LTLVSIPFVLLLAFAILEMGFAASDWLVLLAVFVAYTSVDSASWVIRRWFLEELIDNGELRSYYLKQPHLRRLTLQCVLPLIALSLGTIWQLQHGHAGTLGTFVHRFAYPILGFGGLSGTAAQEDPESPLRIGGYAIFLFSSTYSEAVIATWRRDMKLKLRANLEQAVWRDTVTKVILFLFFLASLLIMAVLATQELITSWRVVLDYVLRLGVPGAALSAVMLGLVAYVFKVYSRFFFGFFEVVVATVFIYNLVASKNLRGDVPPEVAQDVFAKLIGALFILVRGLENAYEEAAGMRANLKRLIDKFGRATLFQHLQQPAPT
jgi:hypothetical protein